MKGKILWLVVSGLMVLSLVMAACGPAPVEEEKGKEAAPVVKEEKAKEEKGVVEKEVVEKEVVSPEAPKYGGWLTISQPGDIVTWDEVASGSAQMHKSHLFMMYNELLSGDWAKGIAGGYGTAETRWNFSQDLFSLKKGYIAESWEFKIDAEKDEGTIVYHIRPGVHWSLNPEPWAEASRLVGGREVTADDVVFTLKYYSRTPKAYIYRSNPPLRTAEITKTGKYEVTVKVPLKDFMVAASRYSDFALIVPPEPVEKYGNMADWRNAVGTGPFMLKDFVPGSAVTLVRNPNYFDTDPVGPGKGNQLPYLDGVKLLIIPDASTAYAALRTGKVDQMGADTGPGITWEDAAQLRATTPDLLEAPGRFFNDIPIQMRLDKAPFNDKRVRRAMMMATDFESIRQNLNNGLGAILTWPYEPYPEYAEAYLGLDDPEMPASVKELYVYNPEKAKALLAEAGYPDGFKTKLLLTGDQVDYYAVIKGMWAKVGIDVELDIKDRGAKTSLARSRKYDALITGYQAPVATFYVAQNFTGGGITNTGMVDDPIVNEMVAKMQLAAATDIHEGMRLNKEMMKYLLDQAYVIPRPEYRDFTFWWPWLKNYSGETALGYSGGPWHAFVWIDQELKKSMGY